MGDVQDKAHVVTHTAISITSGSTLCTMAPSLPLVGLERQDASLNDDQRYQKHALLEAQNMTVRREWTGIPI
jgi:hypothetical protein